MPTRQKEGWKEDKVVFVCGNGHGNGNGSGNGSGSGSENRSIKLHASQVLPGTVDAVLCVRCLVEFMWRVETVRLFIGSQKNQTALQKDKLQMNIYVINLLKLKS